MANDEMVNVRYMVDDVDESIAFYTNYLGFELLTKASPAFADVKRRNLRLLLGGSQSSAGVPCPTAPHPVPEGGIRSTSSSTTSKLKSHGCATPGRPSATTS